MADRASGRRALLTLNTTYRPMLDYIVANVVPNKCYFEAIAPQQVLTGKFLLAEAFSKLCPFQDRGCPG